MSDPPDDRNLEILVEAVTRALKREGQGRAIVDSPPIVAVPEMRLRAIAREEAGTTFDRKGGDMEARFRAIIREESEWLFERKVQDLEDRLKALLEGVCKKEIKDICTLLGLRIDDDHIGETREKIEGVFRIRAAIRIFFKLSGAALVTAAVPAVWALITKLASGGKP